MSVVPVDSSVATQINGQDVSNAELEKSQQEANFDEALSYAACGKFHILLVAIGGTVYMAYGCQNMLSSYVIPAARCDLNLNSFEKGYLNAAYLLGSVLGLSLWGALADTIGRHPVIVISLVLDATISFISVFLNSFKVLVFGRLFNGAIISGAGSLICPYVIEFTSDKYGPLFLCCLGTLYTLASILLSSLGLNISSEKNMTYFNSWRIFELTPSIVSFLSAMLMVSFLPESPKFLHTKGKNEEALSIIKNTFKASKGPDVPFPVQKLMPVDESEKREILSENGSLFKNMALRFWIQYSSLYRRKHIYDTILLIALMFCNMIAYQGMGNWLPELIDRFEEHRKQSNLSMTLCEITETYKTKKNFTELCLTRNSDPDVYRQTYFIAVGSIIGALVNGFIVYKIGFRASSVISSITASALILTVYFLKSTMSVAIVSSLFLLLLQNACMCFIGSSCELYPTKIRGAATCTAVMAGRVGAAVSNVFFGHYLDTNCEVPVFIAIACSIASGLLSFLLPKSFNSHEFSEPRPSICVSIKSTNLKDIPTIPRGPDSTEIVTQPDSQSTEEPGSTPDFSTKDTQSDSQFTEESGSTPDFSTKDTQSDSQFTEEPGSTPDFSTKDTQSDSQFTEESGSTPDFSTKDTQSDSQFTEESGSTPNFSTTDTQSDSTPIQEPEMNQVYTQPALASDSSRDTTKHLEDESVYSQICIESCQTNGGSLVIEKYLALPERNLSQDSVNHPNVDSKPNLTSQQMESKAEESPKLESPNKMIQASDQESTNSNQNNESATKNSTSFSTSESLPEPSSPKSLQVMLSMQKGFIKM